MDCQKIIQEIAAGQGIVVNLTAKYPDEIYLEVSQADFSKLCLGLHQSLSSPVWMFFAEDERLVNKSFSLYCVFLSAEYRKWVLVKISVPESSASYNSLSKEIYSASLFEREMREMFGLEAAGSPDLRRLHLHDEVWPENSYPLRKDFSLPKALPMEKKEYRFKRVEGEGIMEIPVGPVHAGIIGPGHFRFSVAGEPIINLETRLGFTHRGAEKLLEGKTVEEALKFCECICGDAAFSYSLVFCRAVEKICGINVNQEESILRAIFLELERMSNHVADAGGMALDTGFSFPAAFASLIKEAIHGLNEKIAGHRYLKNVNAIGWASKKLDTERKLLLAGALNLISKDFQELKTILLSSVSFMDRVDGAGILKKNTAEDLGVLGPAGRASGVAIDLRKIFPGVYEAGQFRMVKQNSGDALARLNLRLLEFEESVRMIRELLGKLNAGENQPAPDFKPRAGFGLGYVESWRGPLLCWIKLGPSGLIERCKIVDPSFRNWSGLTFAVLDNIVPDFPLCNKSFNLSYPGNDL